MQHLGLDYTSELMAVSCQYPWEIGIAYEDRHALPASAHCYRHSLALLVHNMLKVHS